MEPRPQQPRQQGGPRNDANGPAADATGQTSAFQPGPDTPQPGYPGGYDPSMIVAPPRSDYDYRPLDLAPPGQRRRRQFIAGAIGALSIILLGALVVFAWTLLRDDGSNGGQTDQVAIATRVTDDPAANAAATPPATVAPTATSAETSTKPVATTAPTTPASAPVGTDEASLTALLPDVSALPAGFEVTNESSLTQADVIAALGDSRIAEQNLTAWGWTANVQREFSNVSAEAGATSSLTVSLHGFKDAASAAEALPFYSDILINLGYAEQETPQLGESARLLRLDQEDGGVLIALYVQKGPVLYRFGGYATDGGDSTPDVIGLATKVLGQ